MDMEEYYDDDVYYADDMDMENGMLVDMGGG